MTECRSNYPMNVDVAHLLDSTSLGLSFVPRISSVLGCFSSTVSQHHLHSSGAPTSSSRSEGNPPSPTPSLSRSSSLLLALHHFQHLLRQTEKAPLFFFAANVSVVCLIFLVHFISPLLTLILKYSKQTDMRSSNS